MSLRGFLCNTPNEFCSGGNLNSDQQLQHKKYHNSRKQAYNCYIKYLKSLGYHEVYGHCMQLEDGPVLMLGKVGNYGGELRSGKSDKDVTGKRLMPKGRGKNFNRGLIH